MKTYLMRLFICLGGLGFFLVGAYVGDTSSFVNHLNSGIGGVIITLGLYLPSGRKEKTSK